MFLTHVRIERVSRSEEHATHFTVVSPRLDVLGLNMIFDVC